MSEKTTDNTSETRYMALLGKYQELELRVTRFSAVEQQLVQARDRLDRETAIHSRMHSFNAAAFKEMAPAAFASLVAESLVDILELEFGMYCAWPGPGSPSAIFAAHGVECAPGAGVSLFGKLAAIVPQAASEWSGALRQDQLEELRSQLELREALAVVLRDENSQPMLALLAGNTELGARFYERIPPERSEALAVLAQQVAAHLANHRSRHTIRQQVERIRTSEERLALAMSGADLGLWDWDVASGRITVNDHYAEMLDLDGTEPRINYDTWRSMLAPAEVAGIEACVRDHLEGRSDQIDVEFRMRSRRRGWRWILSRGRVVERAPDGRPIRALGTHLDITDRRVAAERLSESEERLRKLGDNLPNGLIFQLEEDSHGHARFIYLSAGVERIHRIPVDLALQDASILHDQLLEEDRNSAAIRARESRTSGKPFSAEVRIRNAQGDVRWVYVNAALTRLRDGKVRWDGLELDITDRKRLEEHLQQSQKMEGIGHLAGGVAHEFNNLLAAMVMNLSLARMADISIEARTPLSEVENLCRRAADLIKQLLAFSRQSVMRLRPLDMETLVSEECKLLDRLLGERIRIEFTTTPNLPAVRADRGMVAQVLLNLCINARDAMGGTGGSLRLHLDLAVVSPHQAADLVDVAPGEYVRLSVKDTGCGMDDHTKHRLFEPFFTTKEVGQGTGLGLATVRGIVQQHRGWVSAESEPGKGSTFRVYLPSMSVPSQPTDSLRRTGENECAGTVLLVEDEQAIRRATAVFLERFGYRILEAANAAEALAIWKDHRATINLLYTDMVMPGELTGLQLAERILADKPQTKVLLTSGYNGEVAEACRASNISVTFLPKPTMPDDIRQAIAACILEK